MPEMDGYQATATIREMEAGKHRIPIIALTAHAISGEREKCLAAGMDDYLSKPVQKEILRQTVEKWLSASDVDRNLNRIAPVPTTENPLIDFERLQEIAAGDADLLDEIVGLYFEQTKDWLQVLETAAQENDAETISRLAHKCLGGSATCGMMAVVPLFRELENLGKQRDLKNASEIVSQAKRSFEQMLAHWQNQQEKILV
jgi:response regulator RpfG family c-di-GMP phosphodiesterase